MRQLWLARLQVVNTLCIIYWTPDANVGSDPLGCLDLMAAVLQDASVSSRTISESVTLFL